MKKQLKAAPTPDDLDQALMQLLREDGRRPAIDLAKDLQVSEATVRKRMSRLIKRGMLRILAVSNLRQMGYNREVLLQIQTEPGRTLEVAHALTPLSCVRHVAIGLGAFDLLVNAVFHGDDDMRDFVLNQLGSCPGIRGVQAFHVVALLKRSFDWLGELDPGPDG